MIFAIFFSLLKTFHNKYCVMQLIRMLKMLFKKQAYFPPRLAPLRMQAQWWFVPLYSNMPYNFFLENSKMYKGLTIKYWRKYVPDYCRCPSSNNIFMKNCV